MHLKTVMQEHPRLKTGTKFIFLRWVTSMRERGVTCKMHFALSVIFWIDVFSICFTYQEN